MFDVGFWELCLIGLVSLLVIGPAKLPKAARVAGFWVGKARTMVATVKSEIKEELNAEEMRQLLKEQAGGEAVKNLKQQAGIEEIQNLLDESSEAINQVKSSVSSLSNDHVKRTDESK